MPPPEDHDGLPDPADHAAPESAPAPSDDFGAGRIVDQQIERELKDSYLTYAMSTIMDRALPDVRDGLKPSQRRILVAMNDLNLRPGRKHLKCAKICGDTSGNYHPHGDGVIYPTLVNMAQAWRMRVPLIDPQGNFGSIDGDPPAAMRYTEARLTYAAMDQMADLDLDTVDFQPNYDERLEEPTVLPGKFPNLLINGGMGIAVGMATSLAPHNPAEILDANIRTIDRPGITLLELMQDETDAAGTIIRRGVQGPDFPTGGVILGRSGILEAYATGRGKVAVRGIVRTEEMPGGREALIIEAIPYNLIQATLMERIVEAVRDERITDVSDVRNESGREARTRIVIELKKGASSAAVENQLYQHTPLQQSFSIHNIALVGRQPRTLTLREMIDLYVEHRATVIERRTRHLLQEARKKAHLVEGQIIAICDIDEVIRLIRASRTREEAVNRLMERGFRIRPAAEFARRLPDEARAVLPAMLRTDGDDTTVRMTRVQAEAIGSTRLIQLVGLEIERLLDQYVELRGQITGFEAILADRSRVLAIVRSDCEEMRARYGSGPAGQRLTEILDAEGDIALASLIPVEDVAVTISHAGYAKRVPLSTYREQARGGKGIKAGDARDEDFIEHLFVASTHDELLCFTDTGRVFRLMVFEVPEMARTARGRPMVNLLDLREGERTCAYLAIRDFEAGSRKLLFISRKGIVKRTPLKAYANLHKGGIIAVGLKEGDSLLNVLETTGSDDIILVTASGMAIRFNEREDAGGLRDMGRSAAGVKGIDLAEDDEVVAAVRVPMLPAGEDDSGNPRFETDPASLDPAVNLCLLTITENGFGKRTHVDEYRVQPESGPMRSQSRGGKGRADIRTGDRNGRSVAAMCVAEGEGVVVLTRSGLLVRVRASDIRQCGRATQGVRIVSLGDADSVVAAARVPTAEVEPDAPAEAPPDSPDSQSPAEPDREPEADAQS